MGHCIVGKGYGALAIYSGERVWGTISGERVWGTIVGKGYGAL